MFQVITTQLPSKGQPVVAVLPDKQAAKLFAETYGYVHKQLCAAFPVVDMSYAQSFLDMLQDHEVATAKRISTHSAWDIYDANCHADSLAK